VPPFLLRFIFPPPPEKRISQPPTPSPPPGPSPPPPTQPRRPTAPPPPPALFLVFVWFLFSKHMRCSFLQIGLFVGFHFCSECAPRSPLSYLKVGDQRNHNFFKEKICFFFFFFFAPPLRLRPQRLLVPSFGGLFFQSLPPR